MTAFLQTIARLELIGEILSLGVLLMVIDRVGTAIVWTYKTGRWFGHIWYRDIVPLILLTADGISWLISQINWREVGCTVAAAIKVVIVGSLAFYGWSRDHLKSWHADWIGTDADFQAWKPEVGVVSANDIQCPLDRLPCTTPNASPCTTSPVLLLPPAPRQTAEMLMKRSQKELMALAGTRRRLSKAQLVNRLMAA